MVADDPAAPARAAVDVDGCDAIVLGWAGMADLAGDLTALLGVPVVDGVAAAVTVLEGLARQGLTTGTRGEYAPPPIRAPSAGIR